MSGTDRSHAVDPVNNSKGMSIIHLHFPFFSSPLHAWNAIRYFIRPYLSSPSPYIPPIPPQFHQKTNTQSSPFEGPGGCPQRRRGQAPQQRPRHRCLQHWQLRLHEAVARHRPIKGPRRHPEGRSQGSRGGPSREHPPHQLSVSKTCWGSLMGCDLYEEIWGHDRWRLAFGNEMKMY